MAQCCVFHKFDGPKFLIISDVDGRNVRGLSVSEKLYRDMSKLADEHFSATLQMTPFHIEIGVEQKTALQREFYVRKMDS